MDFQFNTTLGRTGLMVSRLGLASGYGISAAGTERACHEFGINYFFWSSPRKKGMESGLKNLVRAGRDKIIIAMQSYDHLGYFIKGSVEKGLREIKTDYADVLVLGWHNFMPWKRVLDGALKLKDEGKIRFIGMSGHNRKFFGTLARDPRNPIDVFMIRYNAAHPGAEKDIFPHLPENNRPGITIYTATDWGKLMKPKKMPADEKPLSAADCYRFVLSNPHVDLSLFAPRNETEMMEGLSAPGKGPLPEEEMTRIRKIGAYVHG